MKHNSNPLDIGGRNFIIDMFYALKVANWPKYASIVRKFNS